MFIRSAGRPRSGCDARPSASWERADCGGAAQKYGSASAHRLPAIFDHFLDLRALGRAVQNGTREMTACRMTALAEPLQACTVNSNIRNHADAVEGGNVHEKVGFGATCAPACPEWGFGSSSRGQCRDRKDILGQTRSPSDRLQELPRRHGRRRFRPGPCRARIERRTGSARCSPALGGDACL